jgi:hypothetical protein
MRMEQSMHEKDTELVESLHQFVTIWELMGKPFLHVDGTDKPGLAINRMRSPVSIHHHESDPGRLGEGRRFRDAPGHWHEHFNESGIDTFAIPIQEAGPHTYLRTLDIQFYRED